MMASIPNDHQPLISNTNGGAVGIVIALILVVALAGGGGFWAYKHHYQKAPLRTKLASVKVKEELVRFTHDRVSRALYHNLVTLDDIMVMMDKELKRLKRIARKFPNQDDIVTSQTEELVICRQRLGKTMNDVVAKTEKMYVTWLVDQSRGVGMINSQRGTLTRQLADAIRGDAVLIGRIRSNPNATS
jgi:hypothetical protein